MNDPVSEYVARLVAAAPPVSEEVRAKLADILGAVLQKRKGEAEMPLIVTITQTYGERITHRSEHNTNEQGVAMDEAILKAYGKGAYLHRDLGLANIGIYGQIVRDLPNNGSGWRATTLTGRVVITIEPKEE